MRKDILIAIIFVILLVIITFPLFFKLNLYIPGFFSTDETYSLLWGSWHMKYALMHGISERYSTLIAFPFGADLYSSGFFSYLWMKLIYLLSIVTFPVLTYNLQVLCNMFLSALFTYLLGCLLIKDRVVSMLSGIIFAFCPYQLVRVWQHLGLTYNQWLPFILLSAILLKEKNSNKRAGLFLLSILLALSFDFSVMYLTMVTIMIFFFYIVVYSWRKKIFMQWIFFDEYRSFFKKAILILLAAFIILSPQFFPIIKNRLISSKVTFASAHNFYHRPFEDLFSQSARPLSYLLPAAMHPVFGKFTESLVGTSFYGESFTEHTLYLGWVPLILAFVAVRRWRRLRKTKDDGRGTRDDFYIGFFLFLAVVAWLFSQPPWWQLGPLKIYMPSFFMYKILPMYRAYCRFGIVVMLAVAVLAGFGLKFILERFKDRRKQIAAAAFFCGLVLFEFWNYPPFKVIDVSKVPAVYDWLKEKNGDFAIAEYPLDASSPNEMYKFYQTKHEKKIINGTIPGTYANKVAQSIIKVSDLKTARILKWMGVKYVLVHHADYLSTDFIEDKEELEKIPKNPGLKLISSFLPQECPNKDIMCVQKTGPIDVYEIKADPMEPKL